jgi:hypothetical protein
MKYDVLFNIEIDSKEKDYEKFLPDKKFKLTKTENEIEEIDDEFSVRSVKFIGNLDENQTKEFIEDYGGYAKVEPVLADVIGMPSCFPAICPAIVIIDEMPYPPVYSCNIFITPVDETDEEFNALKTLIEKGEKELIDYISNRLLY